MSLRWIPTGTKCELFFFLTISDSHKLTCKNRGSGKAGLDDRCTNEGVSLNAEMLLSSSTAAGSTTGNDRSHSFISMSTWCFIQFCHNEARCWAHLCHFKVPTGGATVTRKTATRDCASPGEPRGVVNASYCVPTTTLSS